MTLREYIGARYVPLFMGEWDETATYEPLSIVAYQGNSYTSRQYVPTGIPLTNETFWAETGNYNAQVEAYHEEVLRFDGRITANADAIEGLEGDITTLSTRIETEVERISGISYVGNYGATEKTAGIDWQGIIDQIAAVSDTVYFGCGQWDIGEGFTIPIGIRNVFGSGARFYTSEDSAEHFMKVIGRNCMIQGIEFDGQGKVSKLVTTEDGGNKLTVVGCAFRRVGTGNYGIFTDSIGVQASGCLFFNNHLGGGEDNVFGGVAIRAHTDNIISNCKIFNFDIAFCMNGANISNCYAWCRGDLARGIFLTHELFLDDETANLYTTDIVIDNCELDCMRRTVIGCKNVTVTNCNFMFNSKDQITEDCYIFMATEGNPGILNCSFNFNTIKLHDIAFNVYTFGSEAHVKGNQTALNIVHYESYGNHVRSDVYSNGDMSRYFLTIGVGISSSHNVANTNYYQHIVKDTLNTSTTEPQFEMIGALGEWRFAHGNAIDYIIMNNQIRRGTHQYMCYHVNSNERLDIYLGSAALNTREIHIQNAPAFNINFATPTTAPSLIGFEQVFAKRIVVESVV